MQGKKLPPSQQNVGLPRLRSGGRARRRGNKLLIARSDLDRLLGSSGIAGAMSLSDWVDAVEKSGLKKGPRGATAGDLVLEERRLRSLGRGADARS